MKKLISLLVITIITSTESLIFSQKSFMKFGDISEEELTMTKYDKDTSAGALVLGDFGYTKFNIAEDDGFTIEFTRHVRIKILDKKELDQADFSFYLWVGKGGDKEEVTMLKAFTYNKENGEEVKSKLEKSVIFEEMSDKNHKKIKFSMPNVKVGSVLEVSYKIKSPYLFNLNDWQFQETLPTVRSEYHVYMPEYFTYKNWTTGYVPIQKNSESYIEKFQYMQTAEVTSQGRQPGELIHFEARVDHWSYVAENIPAFISEPFITNVRDYMSFVEFELQMIKYPWSVAKYYTTTWDNINEELMNDEDFGKQLKKDGQFKDLTDKISASAIDEQSKLIMAYETIKNKMVWDGRYRKYPTSGIVKAYNEGGGSSADINLNLVALLRSLRLTANPVLVSTRSNGMLKPGQVILSQFDHVIAAVQTSDKLFLLDATDPYCPYFMLPPNTINDKGLMVSETGFKWVDLYSKLTSQKTLFGQVTINNDFEIEGKLSNTYENFAALLVRKNFKSKSNLEEFEKDMETRYGGTEINELKVENVDSIYKPIKITMNIKVSDKVTEGSGMLYFNPIIIEKEDENYFKKESREYPVDFNYPFRKKYTYSISIPEGYQVSELPAPVRVTLPNDGGKFNYVIGNSGNNITINCELLITQTIFPSTNYLELKKFYELVVAKMAEQVVLKKVN